MNLFQLVFKQMRQRALSTWLTMLSVLLGVGLGIAIMIVQRGSGKLFGQTDYGYDILIGARGSPLQLVLNTVYQLDKSPGNIKYSLYEELLHDRAYRTNVKLAVPLAVGDSYKGLRIVATLPKYFGYDDASVKLPAEQVIEYRPDKYYEVADGHVFAPNRFEALIGSDVTRITQLKIGDVFQATHGMPAANETPDIHAEKWTVAGVLAPTHTAADRVIYIPLNTFYCIFEHGEALEEFAKLNGGKAPPGVVTPKPDEKPSVGAATTRAAEDDEPHHYTMNADGTFNLTLPKEDWEISAIAVKTRGGGYNVMGLQYLINNKTDTNATAVNPATVMRQFFDTFLAPSSKMLEAISYLVTIVAGVGILVSIYNSISARMREIAILRALGATRTKVLALICLEAGLIGLIGAVLGLLLGHAVGAAGSSYVQRMVGEGFDWMNISGREGVYLAAVVALAVLAGLVPALKAYRVPVATNLVSG